MFHNNIDQRLLFNGKDAKLTPNLFSKLQMRKKSEIMFSSIRQKEILVFVTSVLPRSSARLYLAFTYTTSVQQCFHHIIVDTILTSENNHQGLKKKKQARLAYAFSMVDFLNAIWYLVPRLQMIRPNNSIQHENLVCEPRTKDF